MNLLRQTPLKPNNQGTKKAALIATAAFLVINTLLIVHQIYWLPLVAIGLVVLLPLLLAYDKLEYALFLLVPLAIDTQLPGTDLKLSLPTEPLLFVLTLVYVLKKLIERKPNTALMKHPVTICIMLYLCWTCVTIFTGTMPWVSAKVLVIRLWFIVPFFFVAAQLYRADSKAMQRTQWLYIVTLALVAAYTLIHHAQYNFGKHPGDWVMQPFYNDHTAYGAALVFILPFLATQLFEKTQKQWVRTLSALLLVYFFIALVFSYCRAAWLGVIAAIGVAGILLLKIKIKYVAIATAVLLALFLLFRTDIMMDMSRNKQDSSGNFTKHLQSATNISSDASNLERINRWHSAFAMFHQRPIAGFGAGTYQFEYGAFQVSNDKTIITTHAGTGGTAHSEYFLALSETGIVGMLLFIAIIVATVWRAIIAYQRTQNHTQKLLLLAALAGLTTYYVHAALNNFLDTDKLAALYWSNIAIIVSIDLATQREQTHNLKQPE